MTGQVIDGELRALGHRQITDLATAAWADQGSAQSLSVVTGITVRRVDERQSGTATFRFTAVGTLLAYKAPGDSAFGADVNVGTPGNFTLTSANGKRAFVAAGAGLPGANQTEDIEVGIPAGARAVLISARAQNVSMRGDMIAPTAAVGILIASSSLLTYTGDVRRLRFLEVTASATLDLEFFG